MKEVFLPRTRFSMRQKVSDKEIIAKWESLYADLRRDSKGLKKFILQDGPPFANGKPHMGTAFNRILKDILIRYKQMSGFDAPFIPGWDCHGLPIEWKIEEQIRKERNKKSDVNVNTNNIKNSENVLDFRKKCREFAEHWINVQRDGFKNLGTIADWDNPYLTMDPASEKRIIAGIFKLLSDGCVYRKHKPVMWSPVEKTALSDAEIEYKEKISKSIYVLFPVKKTDLTLLENAYIVIWTTTPWTIPGNRAIAYSPTIKYQLITINKRNFLIAKDLLESFISDCVVDHYDVVATITGESLLNTFCHHPLYSVGYEFDVPLLAGDHVTTDVGTGFVHTAPGHGVEDFILCQKFGISIPQTVKEDGTYFDFIPLFAGLHVYKADDEVIKRLREYDALFAEKEFAHSYPHSWRSKAPIIFRATEQWFIDLDKTKIRETSIQEIDNVNWIPSKGKNRIKSFIQNRQEWCISRQRAWGIPLMFFVHKTTNDVLIDQEVFSKIEQIVSLEGSDAWYIRDNKDFLGDKYNSEEYERVMDIVDVWLESGSVYSYVTLARPELRFPADLYLEGSDQHRGWFQSSLLTSVGTNKIAPYKAVLTHGFIVDESGYKMSKSLGNVIDPEDVLSKYGVDVLRLWVANSDYTEDMKIGNNILDQHLDLARKFRNIIKYLLGALDGFSNEEIIEYDRMDILERWCLARIYQVSKNINNYLEEFNLRKILSELKLFCFTELSAFYFDVRKDCLYCDPKGSLKRRGYRTVLHTLYQNLLRWLAPIMSIATEEAWLYSHLESIHREQLLEIKESLIDSELLESFNKIFKIRSIINTALERARAEKCITSNLQAQLRIYSESNLVLDSCYWEELSIVSFVKISKQPLDVFTYKDDGIEIMVLPAEGEKCERCWKYFRKLDTDHLCARCGS